MARVRTGGERIIIRNQIRQDQAHHLGSKDIKEFIESAGEGVRADRERAMLCVAYATLERRGELVALEVRDIDFHPDGTGQAPIRRGKTDAEGQGSVAYLSRETVRCGKVVEVARRPLRYAEKINATRSGMARAAAATGRDEAVSCGDLKSHS